MKRLKFKIEALEKRKNNCYIKWHEAFMKVCGLKAAIKEKC